MPELQAPRDDVVKMEHSAPSSEGDHEHSTELDPILAAAKASVAISPDKSLEKNKVAPELTADSIELRSSPDKLDAACAGESSTATLAIGCSIISMATPHVVQVASGVGTSAVATAVLLGAVPIRLVESAAQALTAWVFVTTAAPINPDTPKESLLSDTSPEVSTSDIRLLRYAQVGNNLRNLILLDDRVKNSARRNVWTGSQKSRSKFSIHDAPTYKDFPSRLEERLEDIEYHRKS